MTQEEKEQFQKRLQALLDEYKVQVQVVLMPANLLAKLLRKFIKVRYNVIFVEKSNQ